MLKFSTFLVFYLLIFLLDFHGINSEKTEFDFGTLSLNSLKLLGDAHLNNGSIHLTRELPVPTSVSGRAIYSKPIRFRQPGTQFHFSFSTFFSFSINNLNPSSIGGGLAFLISPDDQSVGNPGGFLGLKGVSEKGFVGVEFDTLMDLEFHDINGNHVGLDLNSLISEKVIDLDTIEVDLKSGNLINVWIDYDGSTKLLNVSVSYSNLQPKSPLFSFKLDLNLFVKDFMFVGFSGSTQGSTEIHSIDWWSFKSSLTTVSGSPPSPPTASFNGSTPSPSIAPSDPVSSLNTPDKNPNTKSSSSCHNQLCKRKPMAITGIVIGGTIFLAIFACFMIWVFSKRTRFIRNSDSLSLDIIKTPKEFSYKELKSATNCFNSSRIIGHGAFGTVYKGIIPETGSMIAVKRCRHSGGEGKAEFLSELSIIGTLRHRNLVRLQGWCHEKGEILLVYDYMPNGSLDKALFEAKIPLSWTYRKRILMGVASALAYLHQECENQVIHRDIKASNIMLDEFFNGRLGDFGLAKQIEHDKSPDATIAAGTMGYLAPEYLLTGRATDKTDVFSFGAVILEVISGRRPIERNNEGVGISNNLVEFVWNLHREGRLLEAIDVKINGEFDEREIMGVILIGLACSNPDPMARPGMRNVVQMLMGEVDIPIVPKSKPAMCFSSTAHILLSLQDSISDCNEMVTVFTSPSSSSDYSFHGGGEKSLIG